MPDMPEEPLGQLAEGAIQMHTLYQAYVEAGFSETQALQLVLTILAGALGHG